MAKSIKHLMVLPILFIVIVVSCKDQSSHVSSEYPKAGKIDDHKDSSNSFDTRYKIPKVGETFSYDDEFFSGDYRIVVTTTYINDSLSEEEAWEAIQWPIVKSQKVTFKFKDSVCITFDFPTRKVSKQTKNGKSVEVAEIVIWNACLIQGRKNVLFGILEASGLCTGGYCPTYDGVFDLNGTPVYQLLKNEEKELTLILGKGVNKKINNQKKIADNIDSINSANGITKEIQSSSWKNRKKIGLNK